MLAAKEAKKSGTVPANDKTEKITGDKTTPTKVSDTTATVNSKEAKAAARAKILEDKKKALEEKKKKIIEDREAAKKAKEEKNNKPKTE